MIHVHDVAIVGAGAMGSATAWALAKAGRDVVVVEQFELGHERGGSHGASRIFRVGTEQVHYLDMAERARRLWAQLESETGADLLTVTGAIEHGMSRVAAEDFSRLLRDRGVEHERLEPTAAAERWPGMRFDGVVLHQAGDGIIHADRVVAVMQESAIQHGVSFRPSTRVERLIFTEATAPVVLQTTDGTVLAGRVVVTVGPWAAKLVGDAVELPTIRVTQEQPRLFESFNSSLEWPCFVHWREGRGEWDRYESYGLPEAGAGVKVGLHASGPRVDPDSRNFEPEPMRDEVLGTYVKNWFPGLNSDRSTPISCLYDNTDNGDFIIDRFGLMTVAAGFNGEGFKFVPLIGELLRDLTLDVVAPPPMFTVASHLRSSL